MRILPVHATKFDGDTAECVKWLGLARGALSWMLNNKLPGTKSKVLYPADGVKITIKVDPNSIHIDAGASNLGIDFVDKTHPYATISFESILFRDGDSHLPKLEPYTQYSQHNAYSGVRRWISKDGSEAISWDLRFFYYRGLTTLVTEPFNSYDSGGFAYQHDIRAMCVESFSNGKLTVIAFSQQNTTNDITGNFAMGRFFLHKAVYFVANGGGTSRDYLSMISIINTPFDMEDIGTYYDPENPLHTGGSIGRSAESEGGLYNSYFSEDGKFLCSLFYRFLAPYDIHIKFAASLFRLDIDKHAFPTGMVNYSLVYEWIPDFAYIVNRGGTPRLSNIKTMGGSYLNLLVPLPPRLGFRASEVGGDGLLVEIFGQPVLVGTKLYFYGNEYSNVFLYETISEGSTVGYSGMASGEVGIKLYEISIDVITGETTKIDSGIEFSPASGRGLGKVFYSNAYYRILVNSECKYMGLGDVSILEYPPESGIPPTLTSDIPYNDPSWNIYNNGVKTDLGAGTSTRLDYINVGLLTNGADFTTATSVFPFYNHLNNSPHEEVLNLISYNGEPSTQRKMIVCINDICLFPDGYYKSIKLKTLMFRLSKKTRTATLIDSIDDDISTKNTDSEITRLSKGVTKYPMLKIGA